MLDKLKKAVLIGTGLLLLAGCNAGTADDASDSSEIDAEETLVVGLDDTFAPMGFRDDSNEIIGFDVDLAKAVGERIGAENGFSNRLIGQ